VSTFDVQKLFLILLLCIHFHLTIGQGKETSGIEIRKTTSPIVLDGKGDEPAWLSADSADRFHQYFPYDSSQATAQTVVRVTYDDEFIYVLAIMYNTEKRAYVTPSLRRDFRGEANDGVSIVFDTFKDKTNAFLFGVNPFGVQREGLISNGGGSGGDDFSLNWDNKWYSATEVYDDRWVAEMAIPFKTIRFKEGLSSWFVNFYRIDSHYAERSSWSPIPRQFDIVSLAFNRELMWDQPLQKPGANISIIPYVAANTSRDFEKDEPSQNDLTFGGDAKVAVSSALNLDLTINPDFSQVEVDQQVTNLDRFEIFFPERRQFFLENADLFANFGLDGTRPFFSRRIGVASNASTGQNIQNTIYGGLRLSGKINNNTRIGLLNMQAGRDRSIGLPSTNYTVATVQQKILNRSNVGFIFVNKQAFQDSIGSDFTISPEQYNRLIGADFNLATADNKWNGKLFYHYNFDDLAVNNDGAIGGFVSYSTPEWNIDLLSRKVGKNYTPEVGFVRRRDIVQIASTYWYNFYPNSPTIQSHGPGFDQDLVFNQSDVLPSDVLASKINDWLNVGVLDYDVNVMYRIRWKTTANFNIRFRKEYTYLFDEFDPSGTKGIKLPAGTDYSPYMVVANYNSDARKRFFFNVSTRSGQYFNGTRINLSGTISYRYQPLGFASLNFTYNRIQLPKPYNSADLFLIGPRIDLTFTRDIFWTTFFQYNSQISNLNINSRLQWRFKPVSDIFLVYTDNYFAESLENGSFFRIGQPKTRALVLKATYWLNL
jgi:hypothetical protein